MSYAGGKLWCMPDAAEEQVNDSKPISVCAVNDDNMAESTGSIHDGQLNDRINQSSTQFLW